MHYWCRMSPEGKVIAVIGTVTGGVERGYLFHPKVSGRRPGRTRHHSTIGSVPHWALGHGENRMLDKAAFDAAGMAS